MSSLVRLPARRGIAALVLVALTLTVACGSAATATPEAVIPEPQTAVEEIRPILATKVLRVGTQRIAFLLTTSEALIKAPQATVTSVYVGDGEAPGQQRTAGFHLWPYGVRGAYSTELTFERAGTWRLEIEVEVGDGPGKTQLEIEVAESVGIPEIGTIPPLSASKTIHTVEGLEQLTTDFTPDPDLYQLSIAEGVISGRPTVIVFATPAFCTSPTCGPQVDIVSELKELRREEANFIHVEIYDNPDEIQGDLSLAIITDLVHEWGLSSIPDWFNESWTFILGRDGRIAQRFEGFATLEELDAELQIALTGT